jgi:hypothetical protein
VFLDVDMDGYEDILVINGFTHNLNDLDRANELTNVPGLSLQEMRARMLLYPPYDSPNYAFRNRGNLTFEETGKAWRFDAPEISNGIALADLDNDGDQDVVINCLNAAALVYRNDCPAPRLAVRLKGKPGNIQGINALIKVYGGPVPMQMQEILCGGRYQSGDDPLRTFATGPATNLTVEVTWRSGQRSVITPAPISSTKSPKLPPCLSRQSPKPTPFPCSKTAATSSTTGIPKSPLMTLPASHCSPNASARAGPGWPGAIWMATVWRSLSLVLVKVAA